MREKGGSIRIRSKSEAPNLQSSKRKSPRTSLKRSAATSICIVTAPSEGAVVTEIDVLPREIKSASSINYVVENEAASVAAATKEQLIALLTYDSGIGLLFSLLCVSI